VMVSLWSKYFTFKNQSRQTSTANRKEVISQLPLILVYPPHSSVVQYMASRQVDLILLVWSSGALITFDRPAS